MPGREGTMAITSHPPFPHLFTDHNRQNIIHKNFGDELVYLKLSVNSWEGDACEINNSLILDYVQT